MQKVLLVDVDSAKTQNYALMKISSYEKSLGNKIEIIKLKLPFYPSKSKKIRVIDGSNFLRVYVSIIYTDNKNMVNIINNDNVLFGGTGFDVSVKLPPEIEKCDPDYSIYPEYNFSIIYNSRGCIRDCYFCFVPKKEGYIHKYSDYKFMRRHKKIRFLDNNFLAFNESMRILKELVDSQIPVSFNEGLDIRLINMENAKLLSELNYYPNEYIFAFDDIKYLPVIKKKTKILKMFIKKDWKLKYYIYINREMAIKDILSRVNWCLDNKILPYIMRDINCYDSDNKEFYIDLASWCNQPNFIKKVSFKDFLFKRHKNIKRINSSLNIYEGGCLNG